MSKAHSEYIKTLESLKTLSVPVIGFSETSFTTDSNKVTQSQLNFIIELLISLHTKVDKVIQSQATDKFQKDLDSLTVQFQKFQPYKRKSKLAQIELKPDGFTAFQKKAD